MTLPPRRPIWLSMAKTRATEADFANFCEALSPEKRATWKMAGTVSQWFLASEDAELGLEEQLTQISALAHVLAYLYTVPDSDIMSAQSYHHIQMNTMAYFNYVADVILEVLATRVEVPVCLFLMGTPQLEQLFGEARMASGPDSGFTVLDLTYRLRKAAAAAAFKAADPRFKVRDRRRGIVFGIARLRDCSQEQRDAITIRPDEWGADRLRSIWAVGYEQAVSLIEQSRTIWDPSEWRDPSVFFATIFANRDKGWCLARPLGKWIGVRPMAVADVRRIVRDYADKHIGVPEREAFLAAALPPDGALGCVADADVEDFEDDDDDDLIILGDSDDDDDDDRGPGGESDGDEPDAGAVGAKKHAATLTMDGKLMHKATALRSVLGGAIPGARAPTSRTERYMLLEKGSPVGEVPPEDGAHMRIGDYVLLPAIVKERDELSYMCVAAQVDYFVVPSPLEPTKPERPFEVSEAKLCSRGVEVQLHTVRLHARPGEPLRIGSADEDTMKQMCVPGKRIALLHVKRSVVLGASTVTVSREDVREAVEAIWDRVTAGECGKPAGWPVVKRGLFVVES